jgi:hypothetical protein
VSRISSSNPYLGKVIQLQGGALFYVTNQGVAKQILDMDIYLPTKNVLRALIPRLTKGSVVVFDEYNHPSYPGESIALREELGSINVRLRKSKFSPYSAWFVWE